MFEILSTCKGGGYVYCRTSPPHPKRNSKGLYPLHRVLAEIKLGRLLLPGEIAHHKDHDKENNDPDNIEVMTNPGHSKHHRPEKELIFINCDECGVKFGLKPHIIRRRTKVNASLCCSRSCSVTLQNKKKKQLVI